MADVYVNALTQISTEPTTTDSLVAVNRNTNEGKIIDYNLLADVILNKITSKQFSGLNTTSKLLVGAINELDSDVSSLNSSLASGKIYFMTYANAQEITLNLGYTPSANNFGDILLFNSNQTTLVGIEVGTSIRVRKYDNGTNTITATLSGSTITITPSTRLWGLTTLLIASV